jgi:hypothetical protein
MTYNGQSPASVVMQLPTGKNVGGSDGSGYGTLRSSGGVAHRLNGVRLVPRMRIIAKGADLRELRMFT